MLSFLFDLFREFERIWPEFRSNEISKMETQNENLKFILANQMQSFANIVLETMLDKRFYNESVSEINLDLTGNPITAVCRKELIQVSSSALKNEPWALKGKRPA